MLENALTIILTAMFTGVGVTIGTYLANKTLIKHLETTIEKRLKHGN
jgi:uncharacterized protein YneF (UPF0154 family)